jgi:hypothetical protein
MVSAMNEEDMQRLHSWFVRRSLRKTIISSALLIVLAIILPFASVESIWPYIGVCIVVGLIWLSHFILRYRIKKGYFGNNASETREMLEAIAEEAKKQ